MPATALLPNNRSLIGTSLDAPGANQYPMTSAFVYAPAGVALAPPSGDLANYNWHKQMWAGNGGTRKPQVVRLYSTPTNNPINGTTGVTGSAGAYGFIKSDWRAIANDGAILSVTFKWGTGSTAGWNALANNLNATGDNADKQALRQLALNLRRWATDTGNTAPVKKIHLGFHHEPENDDPNNAGAPAAYRAAYRAVFTYLARRGIIDANQPLNVPLDGASAPGGAPGAAVDCIERAYCGMGWNTSNFDYWPGDDIASWCLMDPYNWGGHQSSPTGVGANIGRVPQPGDTVGGNYGKAWNELKIPLTNLLNWSDAHPGVNLGVGEFGTSEYVDKFTGGNNSVISNPKVANAIPTLKGEWYRQTARYMQGLASDSGINALNAFTAEPRAKRIKMWLYWNNQATMPRWYHTIPFQPGDINQPSTTGANRTLTYDGFVAMVNDPYFNTVVGTPVTNPTVTLTVVVDETGRGYTFTATGTAGSNPITSYDWDFGDGSTTTTAGGGSSVVTHPYLTDGTYTVAVTATQAADGGTTIVRRTLTVVGREQPVEAATVEPKSGAPYIRPGDLIADLRFIYNPGLDRLAQFTEDRTTRRLYKTVSATSYTLDPGDVGKVLEFTAATAVTVTIPANATTAFPIGAWVDLVQMGAGQITVATASGVTLNRAGVNTTRAQFSEVRVRQRGLLDSWHLTGDFTAGTGGGTAPGGGGGTTDDLFIFDFNEGPAGAPLATTDWTSQFGATATYTTTALEGAFAARWNVNSQTSFYRKDFTVAQTLGWFSWYIRLDALPTMQVYLAEWFNGATKVGDLRLNTDGTLAVRDNNTAVVTSTGTTLAAGAWTRVAVKAQPGSSTGHQLKMYQGANLHTTTATFSGSGAATANGQTAFNLFRIGVISPGTAVIAYNADRLRGNSTVEPSPFAG